MRTWRTAGAFRKRRGATLVEAAIALPVFLLLVFGTLDLGIAVFRYNALSQSARTAARLAIVHGADAGPEMTVWDSSNAAGEIKTAIAGFMAATGLGPEDFEVDVIYQKDADGRDLNAPGNPVEVIIRTTFVPVTYVIGDRQIELSASSRMYISN